MYPELNICVCYTGDISSFYFSITPLQYSESLSYLINLLTGALYNSQRHQPRYLSVVYNPHLSPNLWLYMTLPSIHMQILSVST